MNKTENMKWIKSQLISHRGFHDIKKSIPENSILAFNNSIELGFGIEFDVRISKDNRLYVFHDRNTKRLCGEDKVFEKLNASEIDTLKLQGTNEHVPTFDDVLTLVDGKVPIMIEIKPSSKYKSICKIMTKKLKQYRGEVAIQSYSPIIMKWFRKYEPSFIRGLIQEQYGHHHQPIWPIWYLSQISLWDKVVQPDFYNYNIKDLPNNKRNKHKTNGVTVISFTARSQSDLDFVKKHYDNAVFELFNPLEIKNINK